jgi:hypothetical protein
LDNSFNCYRLNPRAPDFSSSLHGMSGKQQPPQQSQQSQGGGSQPHQQMQHAMQPMYNMPNQANANPIILNQFKQGASGSYHRGSGAPHPNHHQMPPTRWSIPMSHNMQHQQDLLNYMPQEMLGLENGAPHHHHSSPTNMSPSANNNSPPVDHMTAAQIAKLEESARRVPRPIGTERAWKNSYSMNNPSEPEAWMNQNKVVNPPWAGGPQDRLPYMMGRSAGIRLDELDNTYHVSLAFLNLEKKIE